MRLSPVGDRVGFPRWGNFASQKYYVSGADRLMAIGLVCIAQGDVAACERNTHPRVQLVCARRLDMGRIVTGGVRLPAKAQER